MFIEKRHYCTICTIDYLPKLMVLAQSMAHHCEPFRLWVLAADRQTEMALAQLNLHSVAAIPLSAIEDDDCLADKENRKITEYLWGIKPTWILFLFNAFPEIQSLTYTDSDVRFYASIKSVFDEIKRVEQTLHRSVNLALEPHRFDPTRAHLTIFGKFNGGFLYVANSRWGRAGMKLWRDLCNEWCYHHLDEKNERFVDQRYLDRLYATVPGAYAIQHKGLHLAPWHWDQYVFSHFGGRVFVDADPLVSVHFHRFVVGDGIGMCSGYMTPPLIHNFAFVPYTREIARAEERLKGLK